MTNLRTAYGATAMASLEWTEERERAIDRVAAAGRAAPLGLLIWKARYQLESKAYQAAIKLLTTRYLEHYRAESPETAGKAVEQCFSEFMGPACSGCNGAKELVSENLRVVCPTCQGSGIRRYSDTERSGRMKLSYGLTKHLAHKMSWLMCEIGSLEKGVNAVLAWELEREL